jgi:tetratricopeptide (TPR) repeat protein
VLSDLERQPEAETCYRRAVALKPDYFDAWKNLGILLESLRRHGEAIEVLERAVALNPSDAGTLTMLGHALAGLDRHEEATRAYEAALRVRPDHQNAALGLAHSLRILGHATEAMRCLERGLASNPDQPALRAARAHLDVDQGDLEAAERRYREVIEAHPGYTEAHTHLNELLWQRGHRDSYGASFREALARDPDNVPLIAALCQSLAAVRDHAGVLALLDARRALTEAEPRLLAARARALAASGQGDRARNSFDAAISLDPANPDLRLDYAQLAIVQADYEAAEQALDVVAERRPDDQLMWACRGVCWEQRGDARAEWLHQGMRFVQTFELPCPSGYDSLEAFLDALRRRLLELHQMTAAPTSQTLVGGTQTPGLLLTRPEPEIKALRQALSRIVTHYLGTFPEDPDHPLLRRRNRGFHFAGSWSVALRSGGYHVNHVHPAGWISSAFYVSVPADLGRSESDPQGWLKFGESGLGLGDRERVHKRVQPRAGFLTLFPSYTWHGTEPFESSELRITAPFDVVPA